MAFSTGSSSGTTADINITPLIDVLLVLLIIFMVIVPLTPRGVAASLPQAPKGESQAAPERALVLQVEAQPGSSVRYTFHGERFTGSGARSALVSELSHDLRARQEKVLFIRGDRELEFSSIAEAVGLGHAANAERIGLLTADDQAQ